MIALTTPLVGLVDTNDLAEGLENLVPFLIGAAVVVLVGSFILIRLVSKLVRHAARTAGGRRILQVVLLAVFAVGALAYLFTAVTYDWKSVTGLAALAAIIGPALVIVIRLLDEPADDLGSGPIPGEPTRDGELPPDPFFR